MPRGTPTTHTHTHTHTLALVPPSIPKRRSTLPLPGTTPKTKTGKKKHEALVLVVFFFCIGGLGGLFVCIRRSVLYFLKIHRAPPCGLHARRGSRPEARYYLSPRGLKLLVYEAI